MDVLGGRAVVALGDHELLAVLDTLDAEIIQLQNVRLELIARMEETGFAQELGARDAIELLTLRYRQDRPEAYRDVRLAKTLHKYSAVSNALTEGIRCPADRSSESSTTAAATDEASAADGSDVVSADGGGAADGSGVVPMRTAHAAAIVSELERVRSRVPVEDLDVAEEQLVALAVHLSPRELRSAARQLCDLLDSDGPEPEERKAYARESLTLSPADNGVKFRGYLANENAELLRAVIHAGARPHKTTDGEPDPRPRDKRQADALTTALTLAATAWDTNTTKPASPPCASSTSGASTGPSSGRGGHVPGYGAKANITVTIDLEDLKAATADAIGRTVYGDGLSAAAVRRLACDAGVIPLVLGSNSEPLDVGRSERLVTRPMRRALNARDRGCVVCGAPPVMCDAHHLISWLDGGETKVDNLVLLCRRHHTDLHHGHWNITITNGQVHVARPTWANQPTRPPASTSPHPSTPPRPPTAPPDTPTAAPSPSDGPPAPPRGPRPPDGPLRPPSDPSGGSPIRPGGPRSPSGSPCPSNDLSGGSPVPPSDPSGGSVRPAGGPPCPSGGSSGQSGGSPWLAGGASRPPGSSSALPDSTPCPSGGAPGALDGSLPAAGNSCGSKDSAHRPFDSAWRRGDGASSPLDDALRLVGRSSRSAGGSSEASDSSSCSPDGSSGPWGDSSRMPGDSQGGAASVRSIGRWRSGEETLAEAARFAAAGGGSASAGRDGRDGRGGRGGRGGRDDRDEDASGRAETESDTGPPVAASA